jgi:hypothetical protein
VRFGDPHFLIGKAPQYAHIRDQPELLYRNERFRKKDSCCELLFYVSRIVAWNKVVLTFSLAKLVDDFAE